jgi:hypothetical protein
MKTIYRILKWLLITFAALIVLGVSALFLFRPASPFKSALANSDRLELYLLQPQVTRGSNTEPELDDTTFPIRPYGDTRTPILRHVSLKGKEFEKVRDSFLSATRPGFLQVMCHYPIYGFRFYRGDSLVVETSICFQCNNFYVLTASEYGWKSLSPFTAEFQSLLDNILPPPQDKKN